MIGLDARIDRFEAVGIAWIMSSRSDTPVVHLERWTRESPGGIQGERWSLVYCDERGVEYRPATRGTESEAREFARRHGWHVDGERDAEGAAVAKRILICGSRTWEDALAVREVIARLPDGTVVIHGAAPGADSVADQAARDRGLPRKAYPADWKAYGDAAGPIRNARMLAEGRPDRVIAFRMPGESRGTDDMVRQARAAGIPVEVIGPGSVHEEDGHA